MDRAPVWQENDSQISIFHLFDRCPATDAPIILHNFLRRIGYYPFDPFLADDGPIRALPDEFEVLREFHRALYAAVTAIRRAKSTGKPSVNLQVRLIGARKPTKGSAPYRPLSETNRSIADAFREEIAGRLSHHRKGKATKGRKQ